MATNETSQYLWMNLEDLRSLLKQLDDLVAKADRLVGHGETGLSAGLGATVAGAHNYAGVTGGAYAKLKERHLNAVTARMSELIESLRKLSSECTAAVTVAESSTAEGDATRNRPSTLKI